MTEPTESRVLRDTVGGILTAYGIDNLELEMKLCEAFKRLYVSKEPRRTKDEILQSLQRGLAKHEELQAIADEIHRRVGIRPVTQPWIEFVSFAWKENKEHGRSIGKFLDWWLSDEWQRAHPPAKPDVWVVKWDTAFWDQSHQPGRPMPSGL